MNEFGKDFTVVFSAAVPLPPELLRECARFAGCNVWSEENAVVYASDTFVALHSVRSGSHTIQLPRHARVRDFYTGKSVAVKDRKLTFEIDAPETRMFILE